MRTCRHCSRCGSRALSSRTMRPSSPKASGRAWLALRPPTGEHESGHRGQVARWRDRRGIHLDEVASAGNGEARGEPSNPVVMRTLDGHLFRDENEFYPIASGRYYIPASGSVMRFSSNQRRGRGWHDHEVPMARRGKADAEAACALRLIHFLRASVEEVRIRLLKPALSSSTPFIASHSSRSTSPMLANAV
jgi:hypothetical protein